MKKSICILIFCFMLFPASSVVSMAQSLTTEEQSNASQNALDEKIQKLEKALTENSARLSNLSNQNEEEKAAAKNRQTELLDELNAAKEEANKQKEAIEDLTAATSGQKKALEAAQKQTKRFEKIALVVLIVGIIAFVGFVILFRKGHETKADQISVRFPIDLESDTKIPGLENPKGFREIWEFVNKTPVLKATLEIKGVVEVPCSLKVPNQGTEFDGRECHYMAILQSGAKGKPIRFEGETEIVGFDNRVVHAIKVTLPAIDAKNKSVIS